MKQRGFTLLEVLIALGMFMLAVTGLALALDRAFSASILLRRDDDGTAVSFVLGSRWTDPEIVDSFKLIARAMADAGWPAPFTVRLIDKNLNSKNEFVFE